MSSMQRVSVRGFAILTTCYSNASGMISTNRHYLWNIVALVNLYNFLNTPNEHSRCFAEVTLYINMLRA